MVKDRINSESFTVDNGKYNYPIAHKFHISFCPVQSEPTGQTVPGPVFVFLVNDSEHVWVKVDVAIHIFDNGGRSWDKDCRGLDIPRQGDVCWSYNKCNSSILHVAMTVSLSPDSDQIGSILGKLSDLEETLKETNIKATAVIENQKKLEKHVDSIAWVLRGAAVLRSWRKKYVRELPVRESMRRPPGDPGRGLTTSFLCMTAGKPLE